MIEIGARYTFGLLDTRIGLWSNSNYYNQIKYPKNFYFKDNRIIKKHCGVLIDGDYKFTKMLKAFGISFKHEVYFD